MEKDYKYKWSGLIPLPPMPEATTPQERLKNMVESLKGQDEEMQAAFADLDRVLNGSQDTIDAFMELVDMQEAERQDICTRIFEVLAECRDSARPATPEERQAVADSTAAFMASIETLV